MTATAPMLALAGCDVCLTNDTSRLYAVLDGGRRLCSRCWKKAGRPFPRQPLNPAEIQEAEASTRTRMLKRGGAHAHLVHKGAT